MRKYGMGLQFRVDSTTAPPQVVAHARETLAFNYKLTRERQPEFGLPEEGWEFVVGPVEPGDPSPEGTPMWVHNFSWRIELED